MHEHESVYIKCGRHSPLIFRARASHCLRQPIAIWSGVVRILSLPPTKFKKLHISYISAMDARPARIDALQYLQCMQSLILHFLNVYQRMTGTTILAMRWTMGTAFWTHIKLKQLNGMSNNLAFVGTWTWWSAKKQPGYTGLGPSNPPLHVWYIRRANHSLAHPRRLNYTSWLLITSERTTIVTTRGYTTRAACHVALVATWKVPCWTTLVTTVAWYNLIGTH